ncbi:hypothetical protein [Thiohalocapsa marina]
MINLRYLPLLLLFAIAPALAAPLDVGDALPAMTLEDQHGVGHAVDDQVKLIVFSADRAGSKVVEAALEGWDDDRLAAAGIRYVADISGMPGPITRLFALPSMRKQPYAILLGREPAQTEALPRQEDAVTLIHLQDGTIRAVAFVQTSQALAERLAEAQAD